MSKPGLEPLRRLPIYGYAMQVCRQLIIEMGNHRLFDAHSKADQPYYDAVIRCLLRDPQNIERLLLGETMTFYGHERDARGKIRRVEAHFPERKR